MPDHNDQSGNVDSMISRRTFSALSLAAAAGAIAVPGALASRTSVAVTNPNARFRTAVKYEMVNIDGSVNDKFALLKQIGYDGVEISSPNQLDPDEVIAARDATGLIIHGTVCSTHWSKPLSHPDEQVRAEGRAGIEAAVRDCHRYGGDTVLVVPAVVNRQVRYDHAYERSQRELRRVLPIAEELNVTLAIENVWNGFLLSPLEAARYVDEFESRHVGWYFDIGNIINFGWPSHWIRILGKRIVKLDIKDFSRTKRDEEGLWRGFAVEIGDGDADWPKVVTALREIDFTGWATAEVSGGGEDRLRDIHLRMNRVLQ